MEPSFFTDLNIASRDLDRSQVKNLGPFARAFYGILLHSNASDAKREDALKRGCDIQNDTSLGKFSGSFLLFRGALFNKEWIYDWIEKISQGLIRL